VTHHRVEDRRWEDNFAESGKRKEERGNHHEMKRNSNSHGREMSTAAGGFRATCAGLSNFFLHWLSTYMYMVIMCRADQFPLAGVFTGNGENWLEVGKPIFIPLSG
jgi:hypothetical protein